MPTPPANGYTGMQALLANHFIGVYEVRLDNIACTTMVRQLSQKGLQNVEDSIKAKGYLPQFAPSVVVVSQDEVDNLTREQALTLHVRVLDGNHRVTVCKSLFSEEGVLSCRLYRPFDSPADEKLIANCE